ncbi:MAG: SDR family oxidoreductase [Phycisphaerales bacterium]|nr:SDR family oxidoreductase [Phycisphaerales bacterium]
MSQTESSMFSLQGKVIVVTGATGVLGLSFIKAIVAAGGIVGVLGRNEQCAHERVANIVSNGGQAIALIADVMNEHQLQLAHDKILAEYGKIDGLVNAAGGNLPQAIVQPEQDIFSLHLDSMKKVMDINLWGTIQPTLIFGKAIAANDGGSIVNLSSVSAERTLTKVLGYSLGKAAVDSFTKWFAVEMAKRYGDKIRMNALMPGFFLTEQNRSLLVDEQGHYSPRGTSIINHTPFNRFGNPNDLNGALVWLLSDASKFVTGTKITIDGGFNAFSGV